MNVVTKRTLEAFWTKHPQAETPLRAWLSIARASEWKTMHDIKAIFGSADPVGDNRVVFNIKGNDYRLVVRISFTYKQLLVKFVGTHAEYDKIAATTI
jgi:mRNA interferase HigB